MNLLKKSFVVLNALKRTRSLVRGRGRRRNWVAEVLEPRTLLTMPAYVLQTGGDDPTVGMAQGGEFSESHPVLVDFDADGDLDLIVGRINGIAYFDNVGDESAPIFTELTGAENPFSSLDAALLGFAPAPALADWDADGDLDLLLATFAGYTPYVNTGSAGVPNFTLMGPVNPFVGLYTSFAVSPVPAFGDMDCDGDLDLVVSRLSSVMAYFQNTGTAASPTYVSDSVGNPFPSLGSFASPALGDVDGDGDMDMVAGSKPISGPAKMTFAEDTDGTADADLTAVTGVFSDVFSIFTARAAPALGDLDGDGDQDLLIALSADPSGARFRYYEAVENPVLSAPKNTVPGFQLAKEDIEVIFSVENGNAFSVADPNADGSDLQVTLSVDQGKLTLATTAGLNFAFSDAQGTGVGDGTKDVTMTFRGTLAEINAALDGLKFKPSVDFSGDVSLSITTNDLGQPSGAAALSDTDSVPITVQSVATQVEQLQQYINFSLVDLNGLNQNAADVLSHLLNLTGHPAADAARIKVFMVVVRVFAHVGILAEGDDLFLLERAREILAGIKTHAN